MKSVFIPFVLLLLVGCEDQSPAGDFCNAHEDCNTPMEYLVQSNCPFGSVCIDNSCKVICPLSRHDSNMSVSKSYPIACDSDLDCDCSERTKSISCICLENSCVSVEAE